MRLKKNNITHILVEICFLFHIYQSTYMYTGTMKKMFEHTNYLLIQQHKEIIKKLASACVKKIKKKKKLASACVNNEIKTINLFNKR